MQLTWIDYTAEYKETVESWMDDEAKKETGCDEGWEDYIMCCMNEPTTRFGENFWCKLVLDDNCPVAVIAMGEEAGELVVSEIIVSPDKRGRGIGSFLLCELLREHERIIGKPVRCAMAVIFPDNIPSQKAFIKAGFSYASSHPDGDAWYYRWYNQ